jgi:putative transposase
MWTSLRYVERNALAAKLVQRAEEWRWCSLWRRINDPDCNWLSPWPVPVPLNWLDLVNTEGALPGRDER